MQSRKVWQSWDCRKALRKLLLAMGCTGTSMQELIAINRVNQEGGCDGT
jgi:hypothetical protein